MQHLPHGGGGGTADAQVLNPLIEALTFWDISERPTTNDREEKLGRGMTAIGQAVAAKDGAWPVTFSDFAADSVVSRRPFDPDTWALRIHDARGRGKLSHWVPRNVCDHTNKHQEREHKSTMVIDQSKNQFWAFRSDLEWIVDLGAAVTHAELKFNGAGFLDMLYDGKGGEGTRGALAQNIAQNAGYTTDGKEIAQWWHIVAPVKTGATRPADQSAPNAKTENALRSDVYFNTGKRRWMLNPIGDTITVDERGSKIATGRMFLVPPNDPTTKPLIEKPPLEPETDPESNQPVIPRGEAWKTKVFVLYDQPVVPPKHQYPPPQPTPGGHTPNPNAPPVPTGEGGGLPMIPTVDTARGPTTIAHCYLPADFQGIEVKWPIPTTLTASEWFEVTMEFSVRVAYIGAQTTDFCFVYRATAKDTTPGTYTQVDKSFGTADSLAAGKWKHGKLVIPHAIFAGKEGGVFELWAISKSSSTGPQFILGEFHGRFADYGTVPAGGLTLL